MKFEKYKGLCMKDIENDFSSLLPDFESTDDLPDLKGMIGQKRAVKAINFGLTMEQPGYNIFVSGQPGTGKITYIKEVVTEKAKKIPSPNDWIYVHNFNRPDQPIAIELPCGKGKVFARNMDEFIGDVKSGFQKAFTGEDYEKQRNEIIKEMQDKQQQMMAGLNKDAREKGFLIQKKGGGFLTLPAKDDRPMNHEEFNQLNSKEKERLTAISQGIQEEIVKMMRQTANLEREAKSKLDSLDKAMALQVIEDPIGELIKENQKNEKLVAYLKEVKNNIVENIDDFKEKKEPVQFPFIARDDTNPLIKYQVNLFIDNSHLQGGPVVIETNPTYLNLTGKVEYINRMGTMVTNFTQIKPGSLHRANGGYLVIQVRDIFSYHLAWEALKRALKNKKIAIENMNEYLGVLTISTLKPEPIPLAVKVVLLGDPYMFSLLYQYDEDFLELFKIRADFDIEMEASSANLTKLASFVASHCRSHSILHFDREAVLAVAEFSSRIAGHKKKLSTRFNEIVEILYEAEALAKQENQKIVGKQYVNAAIIERAYRSNRIEEKIHEMVEDNSILLEIEGEEIGQVNGLTVTDFGDYRFGYPVKITAATYAGRKGIINIEREVKMSGPIHSKGILILAGYLGSKYAHKEPLSLNASITFEQTYQNIDGDSASAAELIAIISSLAGIPIKQNIAITGSVNQKGEIQPVGGVIEKIEGFYKTCQAKKCSLPVGVIIPIQNKDNVIVFEEMKDSIAKNKFNIYPVRTIEEALEILTGQKAGSADEKGCYPTDSINYKVEKRLKELSTSLKIKSKTDEES